MGTAWYTSAELDLILKSIRSTVVLLVPRVSDMDLGTAGTSKNTAVVPNGTIELGSTNGTSTSGYES